MLVGRGGGVNGIKRPKWRPVERTDRHILSHGNIEDCEPSISLTT